MTQVNTMNVITHTHNYYTDTQKIEIKKCEVLIICCVKMGKNNSGSIEMYSPIKNILPNKGLDQFHYHYRHVIHPYLQKRLILLKINYF